MKKPKFVALLILAAAFHIGCAWKPEVTAVELTSPWTEMNLPVKQDAVVWKSEPTEFRAVHKADKRTITKNYTDTLKAQGWTLTDFNDDDGEFTSEMAREGEEISIRFYDFDNTGVVIEKK